MHTSFRQVQLSNSISDKTLASFPDRKSELATTRVDSESCPEMARTLHHMKRIVGFISSPSCGLRKANRTQELRADFHSMEFIMPEKETLERARQDKKEGKSSSTQAGEFVREEMHHIREGKHGARSTKQAIAIGLSKARRAGVDLPPPKTGKTSERSRKSAENASARGHGAAAKSKPSATRSRAIQKALEREGTSAASHASLSKQAHAAAQQRTAGERSASAMKAVKTKGPAKGHDAAMKAVRTKGHAQLSRSAKKAAQTRAKNR